jgi:hypothetical protein
MTDFKKNRDNFKIILQNNFKNTSVLDKIFTNQLIFEKFFNSKIIPNQLTDPTKSTAWSKLPKTLDDFYRTYACDLPWASSLKYCAVTPSPSPSPINLDNYIGNFKDEKTNKLFSITSDSNKLKVRAFGLPPNFGILTLTPTNNKNTFEYSLSDIPLLKDKKITIKYSDDFNSIDYDIPTISTGNAVRVKSNITTTTTDNTITSNKNDDIKPQQDKPIVNVGRTFYFNKNKDDDNMGIDSQSPKKCDNFPYGLDCVNDDIGQINKIFFNNERGNVFSKRLLNKLKDLGYISNNDNDPKITQQMYNDIIKDSTTNIIKESVKKVLKEYINKKK